MEEKQGQLTILMSSTEIIDWDDVPDASDVVDLEQFAPPVLKPREHFGETFGLVSYQEMESEMGVWLLVHVYDKHAQTDALMSVGSTLAMPAIRALCDEGHTPCWFRFEELGRTYKVVTSK